MKNVFQAFWVVVIVVILWWAGWKIERWVHYKFSYQSQVQEDLKPLVQRVDALEQRVSALETNKLAR